MLQKGYNWTQSWLFCIRFTSAVILFWDQTTFNNKLQIQGMEEHKNLRDIVFGQLGRPHVVVQNLY